MSTPTTTLKVNADTTQYMQKMQGVKRGNKQAGQSIKDIIPGMAQLASTAGLVATATQAISSGWREIGRRMREAQGIIEEPERRLFQTLRGLGIDSSRFRDVQSTVDANAGAFAQRSGEAPAMVQNRLIDALDEFAGARPSGVDVGELNAATRIIADAVTKNFEPSTFARLLGGAFELGASPSEGADLATVFAQAGKEGPMVFADAFGQFLQKKSPQTETTVANFLEFFSGRNFRPSVTGASAAEAARAALPGRAGVFRNLSVDTVFQRRQDVIGFGATQSIFRARAREEQARAIERVNVVNEVADDIPFGSVVSFGLKTAITLGLVDPQRVFTPRPPRAIRVADDDGAIADEGP